MRWLKFTGFLCITAIALSVMAEVAARVIVCHFVDDAVFAALASVDQFNKYGAASRSTRIPSPYLGWVMRPNVGDSSRGEGMSTNSRGFRGGEFEVPKPENEFRIVCIGGSTTFDSEIEDNAKTYPARLQFYLEKKGYTVKVINAGVPGWTSYENLINFAFRISDIGPDLIIDYDAWNDLYLRFVRPENYTGDNSRLMGGKLTSFPWYERLTLVRILQALKTQQKGIMVRGQAEILMARINADFLRDFEAGIPDPVTSKPMTMTEVLKRNPPVYFKRNLVNLIAMAQGESCRTLLLTFAHSRHPEAFLSSVIIGINPQDKASRDQLTLGLDEMNTVIKSVGQETNTPVFDLAGVFPEPDHYSDYYTAGFHNNAAGADVKASLIADYLVKMDLIPDRYHAARGEASTGTR